MNKVLHVSYTSQLALHMNMQKYQLRFYLLIPFQLLKFRMFHSEIKYDYYIFREISPKLTINIYIYEYAHLFVGGVGITLNRIISRIILVLF